MTPAEERKLRAVQRARSMTARVVELGDDDATSDVSGTSEERIELLVELTVAAWALTGQPWPRVPRAQWPVRVRQLGEEA